MLSPNFMLNLGLRLSVGCQVRLGWQSDSPQDPFATVIIKRHCKPKRRTDHVEQSCNQIPSLCTGAIG